MEFCSNFVELSNEQLYQVDGGSTAGTTLIVSGMVVAAGAFFAVCTAPVTAPAWVALAIASFVISAGSEINAGRMSY